MLNPRLDIPRHEQNWKGETEARTDRLLDIPPAEYPPSCV